MAAGEVFECVELCLLLSNPALQDFNSCFGSNGDVAFAEIYAARRCPQTSRIFKGLPVLPELSLPAFKFSV
ncbi:MAG TPA: hypothetical protein VHM88_17130, partial [Candidatus Acidoferrales bacterium]|nr:hypothetical protein [Candidatus Acidoferrales bacterium]